MQPMHVSAKKQAKNEASELFIKADKEPLLRNSQICVFQSVHRNRQRIRDPEQSIKLVKYTGFQAEERRVPGFQTERELGAVH